MWDLLRRQTPTLLVLLVLLLLLPLRRGRKMIVLSVTLMELLAHRWLLLLEMTWEVIKRVEA